MKTGLQKLQDFFKQKQAEESNKKKNMNFQT
jgi:hypothetical protein